MLSWFDWLKGNRTNLLLLLAIVLTMARPWLIAHGIPEAIIDQILEALGLGSVAAMRAALPVRNAGRTYAAVGAGLATVTAGAFGLLSPNVSLSLGAAMLGASGLGFRSAVGRLQKPI